MKKDFNEICTCLDKAIQNANGKLPLQTKIGTFVNLEKRENGNYLSLTKFHYRTDLYTFSAVHTLITN